MDGRTIGSTTPTNGTMPAPSTCRFSTSTGTRSKAASSRRSPASASSGGSSRRRSRTATAAQFKNFDQQHHRRHRHHHQQPGEHHAATAPAQAGQRVAGHRPSSRPAVTQSVTSSEFPSHSGTFTADRWRSVSCWCRSAPGPTTADSHRVGVALERRGDLMRNGPSRAPHPRPAPGTPADQPRAIRGHEFSHPQQDPLQRGDSTSAGTAGTRSPRRRRRTLRRRTGRTGTPVSVLADHLGSSRRPGRTLPGADQPGSPPEDRRPQLHRDLPEPLPPVGAVDQRGSCTLSGRFCSGQKMSM